MITRPRIKFWCHLCKHEFISDKSKEIDPSCDKCNRTFCEEIEEKAYDSNPKEFIPYMAPTSQRPSTRIRARVHTYTYLPNAMRNGISQSLHNSLVNSNRNLLNNTFGIFDIYDDSHCGNPPASKIAIANLERIKALKVIEKDCAICKEGIEVGAILIKFPCYHIFHEGCILTWLNRRNSCPTCRFEIRTDDEDYERRKSM